ncbi:GNAT family N-acetyltransferase [Kribbella turkmenica]|uniref:GNAT family N-acetyltransferase n=2 Tax=Kribbella turkmenica TaxID=2530375 RepID=A0A4R4XEA6_9ACTN|nr:GNAT family N-acetyltransferase [Kribbella turkmenica]
MELRGFGDEHGRLVAGWTRTAQEVGVLSGREEYPFPADLIGSWHKDDPDIESYLYFDGETPVGYGEVWLDDEEDEVELARVIVDPDRRGRGIGAELVRALLKPAVAAGHPDIFLRVRPENAVAIRTYLGVGFVDVSQQEMDEWNAAQPVAYRWMRYAG